MKPNYVILLAASLLLARNTTSVVIQDHVDPRQHVVGNSAIPQKYQFINKFAKSVGFFYAPTIQASGVLVAPQWVLTTAYAAHKLKERWIKEKWIVFSFNNLGDFNSDHEYEIIEWHVCPEFSPTAEDSSEDWLLRKIFMDTGYDLALVKLNRPVKDVKPALLCKGPNTIAYNRLGYFVGFGESGTGRFESLTTIGTKRWGANCIENWVNEYKEAGIKREPTEPSDTLALMLVNYGTNQRILFTDFDGRLFWKYMNSLDQPPFNLDSSEKPTEFEASLAPGDTGAGLFIEDPARSKGQYCLAGIASNSFSTEGPSQYGAVDLYVNLAPHQDWIKSVGDIKEAQAESEERQDPRILKAILTTHLRKSCENEVPSKPIDKELKFKFSELWTIRKEKKEIKNKQKIAQNKIEHRKHKIQILAKAKQDLKIALNNKASSKAAKWIIERLNKYEAIIVKIKNHQQQLREQEDRARGLAYEYELTEAQEGELEGRNPNNNAKLIYCIDSYIVNPFKKAGLKLIDFLEGWEDESVIALAEAELVRAVFRNNGGKPAWYVVPNSYGAEPIQEFDHANGTCPAVMPALYGSCPAVPLGLPN